MTAKTLDEGGGQDGGQVYDYDLKYYPAAQPSFYLHKNPRETVDSFLFLKTVYRQGRLHFCFVDRENEA